MKPYMNKLSAFVICILAAFPFVTINGQTGTDFYSDDAGLTVGANVPMYKGVESDVILGVTYGHFHRNGLGFRTGFQYSPSVADVNDYLGVPVAFAYRTGSRSRQERFRSGVYGAAGTAYREGFDYGTAPSAGTLIGAFLGNLFSDMEFTAGLTPGYIAGQSSTEGTAWYADGSWEKDWMERANRFSLSLDAGVCWNYSIWRFDLKLMPSFHYNLTNNYIWHKTAGNPSSEAIKSSSRPVRWFYTFAGGLTFRF